MCRKLCPWRLVRVLSHAANAPMRENVIQIISDLGVAFAAIGCIVCFIADVSVVVTAPRKRSPGVSWAKAAKVENMLWRTDLYAEDATSDGPAVLLQHGRFLRLRGDRLLLRLADKQVTARLI